jgi:hypothetical protein
MRVSKVKQQAYADKIEAGPAAYHAQDAEEAPNHVAMHGHATTTITIIADGRRGVVLRIMAVGGSRSSGIRRVVCHGDLIYLAKNTII